MKVHSIRIQHQFLNIGRVEWYYDKSLKMWTVIAKDHNEDQIGTADYCTITGLDVNIKDASQTVKNTWAQEASR